MTTYEAAGVSISTADATKHEIGKMLKPVDSRFLNQVGAFASLVDAEFPRLTHPVLVLRMEEPGSKQLLAIRHGKVKHICYDTINHLVNDIIVMGAKPLAVLDVIICGRLEKRAVLNIVEGLSEACEAQGCSLVGGETSEQPGVLRAGSYVLAASVVGIAEKGQIIDGSKIQKGDSVLALASSGLHTNGYSLVRKLIQIHPELLETRIGNRRFLNEILRVHRCYNSCLSGILKDTSLHGLSHVTGGGIQANLQRILPPKVDASIHLNRIRIQSIFKVLRGAGRIVDSEMLRVFNMGVGMMLVCESSAVERFRKHLKFNECESYPIGEITAGNGHVEWKGKLIW